MEPDRRIRRIAVVGGGTAGWAAAVTLNRKLGGQCSIHVVEAPEALVFGHAESTLPSILEFLRFVGIDQNDFIDKTHSTFSLGTKFVDWSARDQSFWHPFGNFGAQIERRPFHHFWHKGRAQGLKPRGEFFSHEIAMAMANRFIFPTNSLGVAPHLRYALHMDVALAARYLRGVAERAGVIRVERKVVSVALREDGCIEELQFEDDGKLRADLFIDASGTAATLIGAGLGSEYEDWSRYLPCDRVLSWPGPLDGARTPYTRVTARSAGWQWLIPLQGCASNGYVYSSAHQSDQDARQELTDAIALESQTEPRLSQFTSGRRKSFWSRNCVAIGSASGFLEPLASTDFHLVTNALYNLLDHFPDKSFDSANIASYNALIGDEFERIRDFIILHYCTSQRDDAPLWQYCRNMPLPDSLAQRIDMYRATGRVMQQRFELFTDLDWFWVMEGMGITPRDYDPLVDTVDFEQVKRLMMAISQKVTADVQASPTHDSFFAAANARLGGAPGARRPATASGPAA